MLLLSFTMLFRATRSSLIGVLGPVNPLGPKGLTTELLGTYYTNFIKCVSGYHTIHDAPLRDSTWACAHGQILRASNRSPFETGFHPCSSKYPVNRTHFKVASHHLGSICSQGNPGNIYHILDAVEERSLPFSHYSILVRNWEPERQYYDWYLIPKEAVVVNPRSYNWSPLFCSKKEILGWKTDGLHGSSMSITFAMNSQLWMTLGVTEELKKYKIGSCGVNPYQKYTYIELHDALRRTC